MLLLLASLAPAADPSPALLAPVEEISGTVARLRGRPFRQPVATEVLDTEALRARLLVALETELPPAEADALQRMFVLAGLLPADARFRDTLVELATQQIGGLYDPATATLTMVDRTGVDTPAFVGRVLLAHELAHALDDQYVGLEGLQDRAAPTLDADAVVSAIIEGSATIQMGRFVVAEMANVDVSALRAWARAEEERAQPLASSPRVYAVLLAAGYGAGMRFLAGGQPGIRDLTGPDPTAARVDALAAAPPASMEQVLHPEKHAAGELPVVVDDEAITTLLAGAGHRVARTDTLGELYVAAATHKRRKKPSLRDLDTWTNAAASGWGGDRFYLLEGGGAVWVTAWDTAGERKEFLRAYDRVAPDPGRVTTLVGERTAVFSWGVPSPEAIGGALRLTQGGAAWTP